MSGIDKRKIKKFERICKELSELMVELHNKDNNIELFVAGEGTINFLLIDTKGEDENYWRRHQEECVIVSPVVRHTDCGGI